MPKIASGLALASLLLSVLAWTAGAADLPERRPIAFPVTLDAATVPAQQIHVSAAVLATRLITVDGAGRIVRIEQNSGDTEAVNFCRTTTGASCAVSAALMTQLDALRAELGVGAGVVYAAR